MQRAVIRKEEKASGQETGREKRKVGGEPTSLLILGPPDLGNLFQL